MTDKQVQVKPEFRSAAESGDEFFPAAQNDPKIGPVPVPGDGDGDNNDDGDDDDKNRRPSQRQKSQKKSRKSQALFVNHVTKTVTNTLTRISLKLSATPNWTKVLS